MKTQIGIKSENRQAVAEILCKLLADEFVLYTKTRNAHWNVEGPDFHSMHIFFEGQYQQLADLMDGVAERIRTIGHYAPGTLKEFLELTHLSEVSNQKNDSAGFITELLADHDTIIDFIRGSIDAVQEKYNDAGTSDYITGFIETHEKMAWMLRAHLK
ncbi:MULTISPECIES: Dps family protein [Sphingobacterium]|uniref:DNA protection during starvation protein 2 n=3 Tax=Sphingobacterium TaxID=28453 RepID=A0AAJ5C257_9SPHI|nr:MULTISPECIES: DNA starvation/stationary phase protection protein [Sphingobacterium]MBA8985067.1 starvation-inducible DNA-binding protein [Sphingobacterium soli]OYD40698.1 DNA starvation/stationary phase protection protein [Sphingobacterium cellulitidis]OYD45040.1 DNA starvation/stationary phase protection protein [Sphingobacterium cellulitidis]WFB63499.1 DNA starvation/stationary phase protection protein [Sphingobacterium sp. WM]SDL59530.1 starvation-inducible DNA-binding protein [Sphingoba